MYQFLNIYVVCLSINLLVDILIGSMMKFKNGPIQNIVHVWKKFNNRGKYIVIILNLPVLCLTLPTLCIITIMFIIGTIIKNLSNYVHKEVEVEDDKE